MDLSPLRKFEVTGPDSEALLQYTLTRDVKKLGVGQVVYSAMCYEHGGMIDDGTLLRLGRTISAGSAATIFGGAWLREQATKLGLKVMVRSSTDQMHNIAVQGPNSRDILKEIVWTSPLQPSMSELEWFRFSVARIGDAQGVPVVVSRTGYTGELGYEIWCHPRDAEKVFDAVWEAGQPHGLKPMGMQALDMVRIEAGLIFAGYGVLRPDRSVRGRHRLHRAAEDQDRRFHRPRGADPPQGTTRRRNWSGWTSTPMSRSAMAIACMSAARRSAW